MSFIWIIALVIPVGEAGDGVGSRDESGYMLSKGGREGGSEGRRFLIRSRRFDLGPLCKRHAGKEEGERKQGGPGRGGEGAGVL